MTKKSATPKRRRAALAGGLAATAAALAALLAPGAAAAAPTARPAPVKHGPLSVAYVEVNDNELANVGHYTLKNGAPVFDIALIFAANINYDGTKAQLYLNDQVQQTLDDAATQIRPLQKKHIRVELSILGNHQGAGFANFPTKTAAADFARQVTAVVNRYHLDGVDLDDEYADYGANGTPQPNQQSIGWLISALRHDLPTKIVSFYDIGPSSTALNASSPAIGAQLSYAWNPYYGAYNPPLTPGLPRARLGAAAVDLQSTPADTASALARQTVADKYGVFVSYDLRAGDESSYISSFTVPLYGQAAVYR